METNKLIQCKRCKEVKPKNDLYRRSDGHGYYINCKNCHISRMTDIRTKNPDRYIAYERSKRLRRDFGITLAAYNELFEKQQGLCALCGEPERGKSCHGSPILLAVDHCHESNKIRSLLCRNCNVGLGNFKDDTTLLKKAIAYLEKHK